MSELRRKSMVAGNSCSIGKRKKAARSALAKLTKAAAKAVKEKGDEIAEALLASTLSGNASSTRLLLDLAEASTAGLKRETDRQIYSHARVLEAEAQWIGDSLADIEETSRGQLEASIS